MSESKLFLGGVPTKPEVDKLRAKFGVPKEGDVITYKAISETIGLDKETHRWNAVVTAWRKALNTESNVVFLVIPKIGFQVMNPNERVESAASGYRKGCRKIGRSVRLAETTDRSRLTGDALKVQDHLMRSGAAIRLAIATAAKQVDLPAMK